MSGKSKLVEEALRIAREGIEGLAKSEDKTPQELLGGFANQKPRVPFEEWRYEFEPTAELLPSKEFNPESFKPGDVIIPLVGDRTSTGRKITSIAGEKLETPAITEGGPDYMRGPSQQEDKSVWASGKNVITGLEKRIENALRASEAKGYKDPNVYGSYVTMGPQSGDFSTHTAEAIMGMLPSAKIKRADAKEFDSAMREKFADWPGIMSPKAADYVINANAGEHRKAFIDAMDTAYWRDRGFPDASLARYATTTPELVSAPTEAAGYNIARITPSEKPEVITEIHRSYPSTMHGEYVGGLPAGLTRDELFTQFSRGFDADPPARNYVMAKRRSFGMDPNAFQVMEGQDIEDLIRKVTALKNEYAEGGAVEDEDSWLNTALTVARNAADKATFGTAKYAGAGADYLSDAALDALGYENDADYMRSLAEQDYALKEGEEKRPLAAGVGDIAGYAVPYIVAGPAGGALSTLGYVSDYGGKIGKTGSLFMRSLGYADGGEVDDDINDALRIAKADGGGSGSVFMTDANGVDYDAQGNVIPQQERAGVIEAGEPENYESTVKPLIEAAVMPMDREGMTEPSLLDTMKYATQAAAAGQPADTRGDANWNKMRTEAVRRAMGAPESGASSPYKGPFSYNPADMAAFANTLIDFSPVALGEVAHDVPYEAGRTGDYGAAAIEGGINALATAPGLQAAGAAGRGAVNLLRKNPKIAAGLAGSALVADPSQAEAGPARWFSKALEVARQVKRVPQKPVKTKGKKTVPAVLDWGPGIPLDKLAYLNDDEMALIQAKRMFKGKRGYKGIPAFPDPGDTAYGDRGQGTSSSSGLGNNTGGNYSSNDSHYGNSTGNSTVGSNTNGGSNSGSSSYSGNTSAAGTNTTGGSESGTSTSAAAASSGSSGTGASAGSPDKNKTSGPSSGPTSQPARTETSYSNTATSPSTPPVTRGFSAPGNYNPVTSAPSTMASEAALDRIASGSSVIGNTAVGGYTAPKFQDRVPTSVSYTPPTDEGPVDTTGANSPFADPEVSQYDADNPSLAGAVGQYSQYRSPPSPTTSAYTNAMNQVYANQDAQNFGDDMGLPRGGGYTRVMDPTPTSYSPTPSQYTPSDMAGTTSAYGTLSGPNVGLGFNPATPGTYASNAAVAADQANPAQNAAGLGSVKQITDRVPEYSAPKTIFDRVPAYSEPNPAISGVPAPTQYGPVVATTEDPYNQRYAVAANLLGQVPIAQPSYDATAGAATTPPLGTNSTNPFYSSPAQQAADIRRAVALAQGPATTPTVINVPGGDLPVAPSLKNPFYSSPSEQAGDVRRAVALAQGPATNVVPASQQKTVPAGEYDYNSAQDPVNSMKPIYPGDEDQPSYMSPQQQTAYLQSLGDTRSSETQTPFGREDVVRDSLNQNDNVNTEETTDKNKPEKTEKDRERIRRLGRLKKNYMYSDYKAKLPRADRDISNFNKFNKRFFNEGGKVGDSVEAAIRLAKSKLL